MAERQWYYAEGSKQEGPIAEHALAEMLNSRRLPMTTLVWSEHLTSWTPANSIETFSGTSAAPPRYNPNAVKQFDVAPLPRQAHHQARWSEDGYTTEPRPWLRFLARFIDNVGYGVPCTIVMLILIGLFNTVQPIPKDQLSLALSIAGFFVMPIPIMLEPILLALLGATPGKLLTNIRLRNQDGSKLTFLQALQRTGAVWLRGGPLSAHIPFIGGLVSIGLQIYQYQHLTNTGATSWDRNQNLVYEHGEIGPGRIAGMVAVGLFAGIWFIGMMIMVFIFMSR